MAKLLRSSLRWQVLTISLLPLLLILAALLWQAQEMRSRQQHDAQLRLQQSARQVHDTLFGLQAQAVQASRLLVGSEEVIKAFVDKDNDLLFRWGSRLIDAGLAGEVHFIDLQNIVLARGHEEFAFNDRLTPASPIYQTADAAGQAGLILLAGKPQIIASLPVERFGSQHLGRVTVVLNDLPQRLAQLGSTLNAKISLTPGATAVSAGFERIALLSAQGEPLQLTLQSTENLDSRDIGQITDTLLLIGGMLALVLPFFVWLSLNHLLAPLAHLEQALQGFALAPTQITDLIDRISPISVHQNEVGSIARQLSAALIALEQAENQLLQSQKMVALGSLVAGVSHELNTPIGNCYLVASTLWERLKALRLEIENGTLRKRALDTFLADCNLACGIFDRNLSSASSLIRSFKQISIDQTGDQRRSFDLKQLVDDSILTLLPSLKRITALTIDNQVATHIALDSYPGALSQILNNLLQNAAIHGLEQKVGGEIRISAELEQHFVSLQVSDNGAGIPAALINRIFEPFFTTRLGQGGSGLGLHICYSLANRPLGGQISVASNVGQGSTFSIKIPLIAPTLSNAN
jgi:signal transduction histidine kinase